MAMRRSCAGTCRESAQRRFLGYDQPVEIKPMTDGADPNPVRGKAQTSLRLGSEPGKFDGFPGKIERKREGAVEKKGKEKRRGARGKVYTA